MKTTSLFDPEPPKGWMPWGVLAPVICVVIVALPAIVAWKVEKTFGWASANGDPVGFAGLCSLLFLEFGATGALLFAWVRGVERRPLATIGLGAGRPLRAFFSGQAVGFATSAGLVTAIWLAGGYAAGRTLAAWTSPEALAKIAVLWLGFAVQSSVEEILFRGWLMSAIARKLGLTVAVVLTSLVFMLLHYGPGQHWSLMLVTFLFSLFACAWALRAGSIWAVMGWHAAWNWLLAVGFEVPITGLDVDVPALLVQLAPVGSDALTGGAEGPEGSFLCTLFLASASAALLWRYARSHAARREESALP